MKIDIARNITLQILYKIDKQQAYSNLILDEMLEEKKEKLTIKDRNLISEIVYGTTSFRITIDAIIQKYSKIKLNKISIWILNILRMGIYQIVFLDKIPKSAAVNESVNLSKKYGPKSTGFVNAILRKVEKSDYEEMTQLHLKYAMPEWLIEELEKDYDPKTVEKICQGSNQRPKTTIRVNTLKTTQEQLEQMLEERDVPYEKTTQKNFLHIKAKNIAKLDLFQEGYFTVQDQSAGLTSLILNPKPGEKVLDVCSAPGGKTTHLAELMENQGEIMACDLHEHRLKLVEQNAKRLGINIIKTKQMDGSILNPEWIQTFDKILLDVPCMGIGVIKRKPDIKWQRKREDLEEIAKLQMAILKTCSQYLKPGGELVYSTCSILKKENEDIIENFLKQSNFAIKKKKIGDNKNEKMMYSILPDEEKDGFFICKLIKKSNEEEMLQ